MTVYDFLKKTAVDVRSNESHVGNHLKASLATRGIKIDWDKDVDELTDEECYHIGSILYTDQNPGKIFFSDYFADAVKSKIKEVKNR